MQYVGGAAHHIFKCVPTYDKTYKLIDTVVMDTAVIVGFILVVSK